MDFSGIIENLETTSVALALFGAAAIYAQVRFALWATPKVAKFFFGRYVRGRL